MRLLTFCLSIFNSLFLYFVKQAMKKFDGILFSSINSKSNLIEEAKEELSDDIIKRLEAPYVPHIQTGLY